MAWFRVDDQFGSNPKVMQIPRSERQACLGVWLLAGVWSAQHLTDGRVPDFMLDELGTDVSQRDRLVTVGLWEETGDGIAFKDWSDYQPSRADVMSKREAERARKEQWRAKRAESRGKVPRLSQRDDDGTNAGVRNVSALPDPTRPDPAPIYEEPKGSSSSRIAEPEIRPDIEGLLDLLDEGLRSNGTKTPKRTKQNIDAARLLIDRDGYTIPQVEYLIRWSQSDEFWRANIRSMSKLREKADTLRLQSQRQVQQKPAVSKADQAHDFISRLEAIDATHRSGEAAHDHRELGQSQT